MAWTWTYADRDGAPASGAALVTTAFPTQSDAESWLGETWRELADAGVATVTLHEDDDVVYGPMSLSDGA
jgi:hypothetical protein